MVKVNENERPAWGKHRDEDTKETVFTLHIPDRFAAKAKQWKFSVILELSNALADVEDWIDHE